MLVTLFYFFLALLLLITVHEFGHFLIARLCGVKVLRFSFGFGKVLASWHDKRGTEYALSLLPLGGYVKMLDETEAEVADDEKHLAFNNKSVWSRIAIVLGGPVFNFLFAFLLLWIILIIGIPSLAPIIDEVRPQSIAAKAGVKSKMEVVAVNNEPIYSWRDFQYAFMALIGSEQEVKLELQSIEHGEKQIAYLKLKDWQLDSKKPDLLQSLGFEPFIPKVPAVVGEVLPNTPSAAAGIKNNDKIVEMNGKPVQDWLELVEYVKAHPHGELQLVVLRDQQNIRVSVVIGAHKIDGHLEGYIGLRSQKVNWPKQWLRIERERPLPALTTAFKQTIQLTSATFSLLGRLATGKLGLQSVSGPVGIAEGAGESGRSGLPFYLSFLALVSISLGVLNLLPIPMLDGGHLLFYVIELLRRRPISEEIKLYSLYVGFVFLAVLMVLALTNDLARLIE